MWGAFVAGTFVVVFAFGFSAGMTWGELSADWDACKERGARVTKIGGEYRCFDEKQARVLSKRELYSAKAEGSK